MSENGSKIVKNDEKSSKSAIFRSFLESKLDEAKAGYEYYNSSRIGNVKHKLLAERWKRKKEEIQKQLALERVNPAEFTRQVELHCRHVKFGAG